MSIDKPLGMQDLLINTVAGNATVFTFLMILVISFLGARFQMPKSIYMITLGLFAIMFSAHVSGLYLITILIGGLFAFITLSKFFE